MVAIKKTLTIEQEDLSNIDAFCKDTGRKVSTTMVLAMKEYMQRNK